MMKLLQRLIDFIAGSKDNKNHKMTRRGFIKTSGVVLTGLTLPYFTSCDRSDSGDSEYVPEIEDPDDPPDGTGTVVISRDADTETMVNNAIELAGGLDEINSGDTVLIKPNIVGQYFSGYYACRFCTSPEVLRSVIRAVKAHTDAEFITVADAGATEGATLESAQSWGLYDVCVDEGVNFLAWDKTSGGSYVDFSHPKIKYLHQPVSIPETLSSFDHFINVPMLKNHRVYATFHAGFTICMKNFVGILELDYRTGAANILTNIHTRDIGYKIAEIGLCVPGITMNIVDATLVVLSNGPALSNPDGGMQYAEPGLVLASKDRVACDTVGIAVLKTYAGYEGLTTTEAPYLNKSVFEWDQIKRGCQLGLGRRNPGFIDVVNSNVDNIDDILANWV